jgi:ABC-2 type transport system permease protein
MRALIKRLVRASAFLGKEISEVRRQPRLVLSLIMGPFLILLLFGIGFQGETRKLSAYIVVPATGNFSHNVEEYRQLVGGQLNIAGVTTDRQVALGLLRGRRVDLVVEVPSDAAKQIASGAQALLPVYFNEVDPLRRDYITFATYLYANEINKQTVAAAASQSQQSAGDLRQVLQRMRNSLAAIEQRLDRGDTQGAGEAARNLRGSSLQAQLALLLVGEALSQDSTLVKPSGQGDPDSVSLDRTQAVTNRLNADMQTLNDELAKSNPDRGRVKAKVADMRRDLDDLDALTGQFQSINPLVLAAPFYAKVENTAPINVNFTSFYAPGVLLLLLQHIAVTLAALSMVRERMLGTVELFQVSPIRPGEILLGKYASFLTFLGVVSAVLLVLMSNNLKVEGIPLSLGVPLLGDIGMLALNLALVIMASVGLGFLIATMSNSESQAVQLCMLVLLLSVFFSGFFLRLETLWPPVRAVSYALPVTYGITNLQSIMLWGTDPDVYVVLALFMLGLFFGLLAFIRFSSQFRRR